ncbi:uncharacterized protein FIESC28_10818 [Fusarium coffeatum]|uniref:AB hydrolase-1 domain-containing protein n=1 Tax=Fusarium coffeatum TaxID=231269 RepID=A0A366QQB1_9HYPO|nr:uncharacterized protein FIESC28_10818 [Fusarium coffeatum]RBR07101.1 hypothetical protein FIESC28_10818 [Fusarium coffeatum]
MLRPSAQTLVRNRTPSSRRLITTALTHQTHTLSDGRQLGFAEYGKPNGHPIFYFHGFPSSCLEAQPVDDIAQRVGVRLIALDRPGFGLSTPNPDYRIVDWPSDVMELAEAKGIVRFSVCGLSGGGPFALACAYALPKSKLASVGLFASAPHWEAGIQHVDVSRRLLRFFAVNYPNLLGSALHAAYRSIRWLILTRPAIKRIGKWLETEDAKHPPTQDSKKPHAERIQDLVNIFLDEPFRQGAGGTVHEARLLSSLDWGFKLEDVGFGKVLMWHGVEDMNAPIEMIRYMAEKVPGSELMEFEGETHYTMWKQVEAAFKRLVDEATLKRGD